MPYNRSLKKTLWPYRHLIAQSHFAINDYKDIGQSYRVYISINMKVRRTEVIDRRPK